MLLDKFKNKYHFKSGGGNNHWIAWVVGLIGGILVLYFLE